MYSERIGVTLEQLAARGLSCRTLSSAATVVAEVADNAWHTRQVQVLLQHTRTDETVVLAELGNGTATGVGATRHLSMGAIRSMACKLVVALPTGHQPAAPPTEIDRDLHLFARQAGWFLSGVDRVENLYRALATRSTIAQAQGILMAAFDLGQDEALLVLRRRSQETQTRLAEVAAALVEADPTARLDLLRR